MNKNQNGPLSHTVEIKKENLQTNSKTNLEQAFWPENTIGNLL
jgi:hypothetical protein